MAKVMKTCRVCGKRYETCKTEIPSIGIFRWQDVACSPECGSIYLDKLNKARGIVTDAAKEVQRAKPVESALAKLNEEKSKAAVKQKKTKKAKSEEA